MRGQLSFVRNVLAAAALALPLIATGHANAADARRVIITQGADYSGFDSKTIKGVVLPGCQSAVLDARRDSRSRRHRPRSHADARAQAARRTLLPRPEPDRRGQHPDRRA